MTRLITHAQRTLIAVLAVIATAGLAIAYEVEPMRIILDLGSGRTSTIITINNTRDSDLPVEIVMKRRIVHPDGTQEFLPAEDDFSVFPPQALVPAGQSQAVRISYIGDPDLEDSAAFIAEVQEVPVSEPGFTGVVFAYNFGVAICVRADDARADVAVSDISREVDGLVFTASNSGTDFAMLSDMALRLAVGEETVRLTPAQLAELVENPIIPPHGSREFRLPITGLPDGPLTIAID